MILFYWNLSGALFFVEGFSQYENEAIALQSYLLGHFDHPKLVSFDHPELQVYQKYRINGIRTILPVRRGSMESIGSLSTSIEILTRNVIKILTRNVIRNVSQRQGLKGDTRNIKYKFLQFEYGHML